MIRNKATNPPPWPTRRMRKERQNFMVRNGAKRADTKKMRTYDDFVDMYCKLIDDIIEPNIRAMVTPEFSAAVAKAVESGDLGLSFLPMGEPIPGSAEKHYLHVKDVKTGEIVDPAYKQFIKPIKDQFNNGS